MLVVGSHISIENIDHIYNIPLLVATYNISAFAFFPPRKLQDEDAEKFKFNIKTNNINIDNVLPHCRFDINIASGNDGIRSSSITKLITEMTIVEQLGIKKLNFHPGSSKDISLNDALSFFISSLVVVLSATKNTVLVIENMSGGGNLLFSTSECFDVFFSLCHRNIFNILDYQNRIGFCIDTCHMFASGYDIREFGNFVSFFNMLEKFGNGVCGLHLNDSLFELNCKKDRHEKLGKGFIGLPFFCKLLYSSIKDIPAILETPGSSLERIEEAKSIVKVLV